MKMPTRDKDMLANISEVTPKIDFEFLGKYFLIP